MCKGDLTPFLARPFIHLAECEARAPDATTHPRPRTYDGRAQDGVERVQSVAQAERWWRDPLRERASFSESAVLTNVCIRTSFRTQNSFKRRAMRRGMRVAS